MFNFFFEGSKPATNFSAKGDDQTVMEIHNIVDTAAENALQEAKKALLNLSDPELEKQVAALKAAGFVNVPVVKEWNEKSTERLEARDRVSAIEKYAQRYPGYKFIFTNQVIDLCKKYNLVCAPVGKYRGTVPKKNLEEISKFKAADEDIYVEDNSWSDRTEFDFSKISRFRNKVSYEKMRQEYNRRLSTDPYFPNLFAQAALKSTEVPLFICAPKSDIILSDNDKVSNEVFVTREIKDPIVLHFVRDGFLVVTKWGLESSDDSLVNEKMN